jgi:hypothetical protein
VYDTVDTLCYVECRKLCAKLFNCHHDMARCQVAARVEGIHIWKVTDNVLNNQSQTANKGWSSSFRVEPGVYNSPPRNVR